MQLRLLTDNDTYEMTPAASDGEMKDGVAFDTVPYTRYLIIVIENRNTEKTHTVSIERTVIDGEVTRTYEEFWYTIGPASRPEFLRPLRPVVVRVGPFDLSVPVDDLSDLGAPEGAVQIRYFSGTDGLRVAAYRAPHLGVSRGASDYSATAT